MIWLNPWAWLGLPALAVPILVHLLARRRARPLPFPTLRFLGTPRTVLARRDRLSDLALLAVRAGIVVAAVAALAQPHLFSGADDQEIGRALARAVIVDASASMNRAAVTGGSALDAARREGQRLAAEAATSQVRETLDPARSLDGEVAWLAQQPGRRELILVSDFQTGTISNAALATLPAGLGVRLVRIDVAPDQSPIEIVSTAGTRETTAHIALTPAETRVEWTSRPSAMNAAARWPALLAADAERSLTDATLDAARAMGAPPLPADRNVAIVFPGSAERASLIKEAATFSEPWMFDAVARLRRDATLASAAMRSAAASDLALLPSPVSTVVATDRRGGALVVAASSSAGNPKRLLLFSSSAPGTLVSAALVAGITRAIAPAAPASELDPSTIGDETLRQWERAPGSVATPRTPTGDMTSDGRWFWAVALVLLLVETWMRRRKTSDAAAQPQEVTHARVA